MTDVTFRSDMTVELVDSMGDEQSIVRAARVSTLGAQAEATEAAGLVRFLVREQHWTPLESPVMTFRIEAPIFVTRQVLKHRIASINEESGRYRELEPVFYVPSADRPVVQVGKTGDYEFEHDRGLNLAVWDSVKLISRHAWGEYRVLTDEGVAKEAARMVLPLNIYSTMYMTANLRSWLNFVKLRTLRYGSKPQYEIALVGEQVRDVLVEKFPTVMDQFEKESHI